MLLDPFEEQLNLPSLVIDGRHSSRWDLEIVRQEDESFVDIGGVTTHAAKPCWKFPEAVFTRENYGLITADTGGSINRVRTAAAKSEIAFRTKNKVSRRLVETE